MKAIKTAAANFVFNPPSGGEEWCDPVWVERTRVGVDGGRIMPCIKLTYKLDPNDLVRVVNGARIELMIIGEGMPPISMSIMPGDPLAVAIPAKRVPGPPAPPQVPGPAPVG